MTQAAAERRQSWTLIALIVSAMAGGLHANETDQFLHPPDGSTYTDVSHLFHIAHYRVLESTVEHVNRQITRALRRGDERRLAHWHRPERLADGVRQRFGAGFFEMMRVEEVLHRRDLQTMADDNEVLAFRNPRWIFHMAHLPIDPRNSVLLFQSSTMNINGVIHGVDKWGHFHDLGHIYYKSLLGRMRRGASEDEALAAVVQEFSRGLISESAIIGKFATGVQSNADLASNYAGYKFYRNLAEPIMIGDRELPPLVIRRGNYWALADHVRPEGTFMHPFITDHWNEALNPCRYEPGLRLAVARRIRDSREEILSFYQQHQGIEPTREAYEQLIEELSTFYGEDYGYLPVADHEATIARLCFDDDESPDADAPIAADDDTSADPER